MQLIDTHAHLCDEGFDQDRKAVLSRARAAGVEAIVIVGEDLADAGKNIRLAAEDPLLKPAAGLYPTILDLDQAEDLMAFIREHRDTLVAIGEVGLDYWQVRDTEDKTLQREIFSRFIRLSNELDLPLNVHSRSAGRHAVALLLELKARRVQLHAFDGKASSAFPALEAGYFFSIPTSIVRSGQKQKLVKHLPLECLLVETDSPVLGPEPDQRNEPANLPLVVETIAGLKGVAPEMVARTAFENTRRLYGDWV